MDEDCKKFGIKPPRTDAEDDSDDFELWEENQDSFNWFVKMNRRWIFNPMDGKRIRLDDHAVAAQLDLYGVKKSKRKIIMDDLLAMETAALEVFNRE